MATSVAANTYVALRTPSDMVVPQLVKPNTTINLGKYGSFPANSIIGRPYYLTFEVLDERTSLSGLRVISAAELYADIQNDDVPTLGGADAAGSKQNSGGVEYDLVGEDGQVAMRTNRGILDDPNSQILTMDEIEAMKADGTTGKELVDKILKSHSAIDQKTAFALAKYTLRKTKKYLKRFTILPLDVSSLASWIFNDREALKIMDVREEILALIGSWSNVHHTPCISTNPAIEGLSKPGSGRWLIVDETAGLLTAYMAEKMGILNLPKQDAIRRDQPALPNQDDQSHGGMREREQVADEVPQMSQSKSRILRNTSSTTNTITLVHSASQPNLSLLKYFHFDPFNPYPNHPLAVHLKTLSWLQLLSPEDDGGYKEPTLLSYDELQAMKSGKRSNYYRKRRRWERIRTTVDETRAGGFDGLIIGSNMQPATVLHHLVPLLRGGAQVVVYEPTIEALTGLADLYSTSRRTAYISDSPEIPTEDFPVNPTLLLAPTIQTVRARTWQVLPGRTHPLMTGKGGSDGFIFTATKVLPADGKIEARGKFKRRKVGGCTDNVDSPQEIEGVLKGDVHGGQGNGQEI